MRVWPLVTGGITSNASPQCAKVYWQAKKLQIHLVSSPAPETLRMNLPVPETCKKTSHQRCLTCLALPDTSTVGCGWPIFLLISTGMRRPT